MPLGRNIHLHFQSICLRYRLQQPSFFLKICNNCQQMPPLICFSQSAPTVVRQFKRNLSYLRSGLPKEIIRDTVCACIVRMQFSLQFRFPFPPAPCGLFYLACHHQCRAAIPSRRPTGPFRLLCSVLSGRVKPWMYSRATSSGKTVCGTPARLLPGLFSAQGRIQGRCCPHRPRRKYATGSLPCCEGVHSALRVLPHRR